MTYEIVVTDTNLSPMDLFDQIIKDSKRDIIVFYPETEQELEDHFKTADIVIDQSMVISARIIDMLPTYKPVSIIKLARGTENIDRHYAAKKGVLVFNINYDMTVVAEQALTSIRDVMECRRDQYRRIDTGAELVEKNRKLIWAPEGRVECPHYGESVFGVVGYGAVGSHLVKIARESFNNRVLVCDPYVNPELYENAGLHEIEDVDDAHERLNQEEPIAVAVRNYHELFLKTLARQGNRTVVVSFHVPRIETPEKWVTDYYRDEGIDYCELAEEKIQPTVDMLTYREMELIGNRLHNGKRKPRTFFHSNCRPGVIRQEDAIRALLADIYTGLGLDVFETEPLPIRKEVKEEEIDLRKLHERPLRSDSPWLGYGMRTVDFIATYHGGSTFEGIRPNMQRAVAAKIIAIYDGKLPEGCVNAWAINELTYKKG